MGTIKKRRRNTSHKNLNRLTFLTVLMLTLFLGSKYFLQSYNMTVAKELQSLHQAILESEEKVATMRIEVKQLENRERVLEIVEEEGLQPNQDNVVAVGE